MILILLRKSLAVGVLFCSCFPVAKAAIHNIHRDALPQSPEVLRAYQTVSDLEPIVVSYPAEWNSSITQKEGTSQLRDALKNLSRAQKSTPQNEELLLLLGLTAHYAYNVDIANSWDISVNAYQEASQLAPRDIRPTWFQAVNLCQSSGAILNGMQMMLSIEAHDGSTAPPEFWVDYGECAYLTGMPTHAAKAITHTDEASFPESPWRNSFLKHLSESLLQPDDDSTYDAAEVWKRPAQGEFVTRLCGLYFKAQPDWQVGMSDAAKGSCTMPIALGPYQGTHRQPSPTLFIIVREAKAGESLDDFYKALTSNSQYQMLGHPAMACPVTKCITAEQASSQIYPDEGGGHFLLEVFAANEPAFPGLRFEVPTAPGSGDANVVVHSKPMLQRYHGTLYYAILLDTTASVYDRAQKEYATLLKSLRIDLP